MTSCPHKAAFGSGNVLATCQWQPTWPHTMCIPWVRICRMHTKVNRSSSSTETNLCNNVQRSSHSSLFQSFHSFFFFFLLDTIYNVFVFSSSSSGGFVVSGQLLGLAWCLHDRECHPVSYHKDLQEGRATINVQRHVGN